MRRSVYVLVNKVIMRMIKFNRGAFRTAPTLAVGAVDLFDDGRVTKRKRTSCELHPRIRTYEPPRLQDNGWR